MKNRKKRYITEYIVMVILLLSVVSACGKNDSVSYYDVYYSNQEENGIITQSFEKHETDTQKQIDEVLAYLAKPSDKLVYKNAVGRYFDVLSYELSGDQIILNLSESYFSQDVMEEVLSRASIVRSLGQIEGVNGISFLIEGKPLIDNLGNPVGIMKPEMFIVNAGKEINAYDETDLFLYFADEEGSSLTRVGRHIVFNTNIPLERQVIDELIKGPMAGEKGVATLSPDTKVISTTVTDGTCYVSFDNSFLQQNISISPESTIYSIVNSLIELNGINKVQISIDADTSLMFREVIPLSMVFERNLEIVSDH